MKIEMGESLFYSWLRHVKDCQIVQTNWKVSPQWILQNRTDLESLMQIVDTHFSEKYHYSVFKKNASLSQLLQQGECDAIGISIQNGTTRMYAVDVAFHESGLNYGGREVTVMKVIAKTVRTALCLWGYMDCHDAEIIFASPKITPAVLNDLIPCMEDINQIFSEHGFAFKARLIANESFHSTVLQPILLISNGIADTSELFLRAYQMYHLFSPSNSVDSISENINHRELNQTDKLKQEYGENFQELKIGKLARIVLARILEENKISTDELTMLQQAEYSKTTFGLQYPLLVKEGEHFDPIRYYAQPIKIYDTFYHLCSQWFETPGNNDRPYLIKWISEHI